MNRICPNRLHAYPQSSTFTIYILSPLPLDSSVSQGLVLSSLFLLCFVYRRSSSRFQVTILHYPSLNLWYIFGLLACWFTLFELKILFELNWRFVVVTAIGKSFLCLTDSHPWVNRLLPWLGGVIWGDEICFSYYCNH